MSDAQGKNDPATGEPIEERAAETPTESPVADAPVDERPSALADAIGEDPDVTGDAARPAAAEPAEPVASATEPEPAVEAEPAEPAAAPAEASSEPAAPAAEAPTRAARRSAAEPDTTAAAEPAQADAPDAEATAEPAATPAPDYAALAAELDALDARHGAPAGAVAAEQREAGTASSGSPWFERADETQTFRATEPEEAPAVTASEPAAETVAVAPAPAPQPVFVEAPEPPTKRGNRGAAGLIGLLAAIVFAVLYFVAVAGYVALTDGFASVDDLSAFALETVTSATFWIPVVAFFLGFWLLGAIVNRARWGAWVLLGFFVAVVVYAAQVFAPVIAAPFWMITPRAAVELLRESALTPLAIAAFVIAREVTIWFGAWAARRGAKMNRLNAEAQEEYERTLEAGPSA